MTADTKEEAELLAREDQVRGKAKKVLGPTVGEAVRRYIDSRDAVLSPATVAGYHKILKNYFATFKIRPCPACRSLNIRRT